MLNLPKVFKSLIADKCDRCEKENAVISIPTPCGDSFNICPACAIEIGHKLLMLGVTEIQPKKFEELKKKNPRSNPNLKRLK